MKHELIKKRRQELNMTLEQVATKVGVGKSTVRKWENGLIKEVGYNNVQKLESALLMTPGTLSDDEVINEYFSLSFEFRRYAKSIGWEIELIGCDERGLDLFKIKQNDVAFIINADEYQHLMESSKSQLDASIHELLKSKLTK